MAPAYELQICSTCQILEPRPKGHVLLVGYSLGYKKSKPTAEAYIKYLFMSHLCLNGQNKVYSQSKNQCEGGKEDVYSTQYKAMANIRLCDSVSEK